MKKTIPLILALGLTLRVKSFADDAPPPPPASLAHAAMNGLASQPLPAANNSEPRAGGQEIPAAPAPEPKPVTFRMPAAVKTFKAPPRNFDESPPRTLQASAPAPENDPARFGVGTLFSILFWWWCGVTLCRLAVVIPARRLGLWHPDFEWLLSLLWPWRPFYALLFGFFRWLRERKEGKEATSKWTPLLEMMTLLYRPGAVLFGRLRAFGIGLFQACGWFIERHIVLLGATAAGKTRWLITLLGLAKGNVFVIDVAAQMVNAVGRRLGAGGRGIIGLHRDVRVLDPYGMARAFKTSRWNVFCEIDRFIREHGGDPDKAVGFVMKVAEGLIRPEGNPANAWVTSEATSFAGGVILYMGSGQHLCRNLL